MGQPVVHFEISGSDGTKSREFYQQLFNWQYEMMGGMDYGMVAPSGEGSIGGGIGAVQEGAPPSVTVYVQVDDLQAYLDKAEELGGKTIVPPTQIPNTGSFALFADPDGICIGLFKQGE